MFRLLRCATVLLLFLVPTAGSSADAEDEEFFERKIRPVLVKYCYECHSAESPVLKGGLRLDTRETSRQGGDSGPAVVPGDIAGSLLIDALRYESFQMPPKEQLPEAVIGDFVHWIEAGAHDPRHEVAATTHAAKEAAGIDFQAARQFWSFQPPGRHALPAVERAESLHRPLDWFIQARLEAAGLELNEPADRRALVRRLSFDLRGLPPTPEEVELFVSDDSPRAYEVLVERLLASPHYGERWARMWLDIARYAEDQAHIVGSNKELFYPNAYRYRDWVVRALNGDMPYDQFVRLQLAADLVAPDDDAHQAALGFIGLGPKYYRRNAPDVMADEWEDRVDTVTRGLLGLTVACARCHDHKYDPIPTEDYYALAGVFAGTQMFNKPLDGGRETKNGGEAKNPEDALHVIRDGSPTDLNVMIRGDVDNKGPVVPRRFLQVLCEGEPQPFTGNGRLELAEAIVAPENPLTARVIVNRVWGQHFGQPLVDTPSNFGNYGQPPTHPELLDDLAVRFIESGWSLKWLHREIVLSATYRQSSRVDVAQRGRDPANRLLSRMNRRRLDVESWRDAILAAAGSLDTGVGGPSIDPADPRERRRTIYSYISRFELNELLALFDFPDPNVHSDRRVETTTPLQKLFVLNSPLMVEQAKRLNERLAAEAGDDQRARIERAHALLYGRPASEDEVQLGLAFVGSGDERPWTDYCQVLLASNEMLIVD